MYGPQRPGMDKLFISQVKMFQKLEYNAKSQLILSFAKYLVLIEKL